MCKKQIKNKLNSQKGMTAAEVIIALLIIISTLGVIAMIYTNLVLDSRGIDRKTGATRIATNILENISMNYYDEIQKKLEQLATEGIAKKISDDTENNSVKYTIGGGQDDAQVFGTTVPSGYTVDITLKNSGDFDLVKEITVDVIYKLDGNNENVSLTKVVEREQVRECNSPRFDEEYLAQFNGLTTDDVVMSYEGNLESVGDGQTIVCPVKYNGESYEIITTEDELKQIWYSYSNRQWARVLILTSEEYAECVENPKLISEMLKDEENNKSYVWIPRFGVEKGGNLPGDTYFKYKATDYAIMSSYNNEEEQDFIHYYIEDNFDWSDRGIEFKENDKELTGRWLPYREIKDETNNSLAYQLNISQYGPLLEY